MCIQREHVILQFATKTPRSQQATMSVQQPKKIRKERSRAILVRIANPTDEVIERVNGLHKMYDCVMYCIVDEGRLLRAMIYSSTPRATSCVRMVLP